MYAGAACRASFAVTAAAAAEEVGERTEAVDEEEVCLSSPPSKSYSVPFNTPAKAC